VVDDILAINTECGTAINLDGAAATLRDSTITTAGDHVHRAGCALSDNDEAFMGYSDGITFVGPGHLITGNTITDPSDIGIVFFGGRNTVISGNTIHVTAGNHGAFAGIAIHPWIFGDVSGVQVVGNQVINDGDENCGGIHAGINIGAHMWGKGCVTNANSSAIGNPGICLADPPQPAGMLCTQGMLCQVWAHVGAGETFTLTGNHVAGAQINYLIEGLDLVGILIESDNTSDLPRMTDWEAAASGCLNGGNIDTWGAIDRVAHDPALPGWVDLPIHCEG
jgi:parallel beta-helix repeat protein